MRTVLFITPFPTQTMEYVRAAASLDEIRMLGIAQEVPGGGDAGVFADLVTMDNADDPAQLVAAIKTVSETIGIEYG